MTHKQQTKNVDEPPRLPRAFHLEAEACGDGRLLLMVSGAKRIVSYTPTELILDLGKNLLCASGRGLLCRSFSSGVLEIRGVMECLDFRDRGVSN